MNKTGGKNESNYSQTREQKPYKIINNVASIKENAHCIIVNTKKNCLMYSKPEFGMDEEVL